MRNFLLIGLMIIFSWGLLALYPGQPDAGNPHDYQGLYQVMEYTGASIVQGEIHYWAELDPVTEPLTAQEVEEKTDQLFQLLAGKLGGAAAEMIQTESSSSFSGRAKRSQYIAPGLDLQMDLQLLEQDGQDSLHLLVVLRETGEPRQLDEKAYQLLALLNSRTRKSSLSVSLTGHLEEKMDLGEMEKLAFTAAREAGGSQLQCVSDGSMVSLTGYLPQLQGYLQAENMRINLNLALRYDEHEGKTVVRAGTPLIAGWH